MERVEISCNGRNLFLEVDQETARKLKQDDEFVVATLSTSLKDSDVLEISDINGNDAITDTEESDVVRIEEKFTERKKDGFYWTHEAVKLLITLRGSMNAKFHKPCVRKRKVWEQLASNMEEMGGYQVTGTICDEKWRNLYATYRRNKKKYKANGVECINWPFYDLIDEVISSKVVTEPPAAQIIATSLPQSALSQLVAVADSSPLPLTSVSSLCNTSNPGPSETKASGNSPHSKESSPPVWFLEYVEHRKKEDKKRDQQFEKALKQIADLEQQKIDLLRKYLEK